MSLLSGLPSVANLQAPQAKRIPHVFTLHGTQVTDNYAWMKNRQDPDLMPYLTAENSYTQAVMADTTLLQEELYREMRRRVKEDNSSVPARQKKHFYYTRTRAGDQYAIRCRKSVKPQSHEQVILDENLLAQGEKFFSIGDFVVSPSGEMLAYTADTLGYRQYALYVKNINTGEVVTSAHVERVTSVVWADKRTLLYVTEDEETKRSNQLWRHRLGSTKHELVLEEKDEFFELALASSSCGKFIFLNNASHTTSSVSYIRDGKPREQFKLLTPKIHKVQYTVESDGKHFYILTSYGNAKDRRVLRTTCDAVEPENWIEIIPCKPGLLLENIELFKDHLVVYAQEEGLTKIRVEKLSTGMVHWIEFPEPIYEVAPEDNFEFKSNVLRLTYKSMVTPPTVWDYDMDTASKTILKQEVFEGYDQSKYKTERIYATARDGTRIPMSIVYKGDLVLDGKRPCLLYGYGSYGISITPDFRNERLSLLDRGVLYVIAHIRGGSDMGEVWHEQGKMMKKMNTFTDFIDCADMLKANGYTSKDKLVLQGGSAGGLLLGAVMNLRKDVARGAIVQMPFLDVINTMLDESNPLTVAEFEEWGNPKEEDAFKYMMQYSPYDNIVEGEYPRILVEGAFHDSQVGYWEPAKYVAKMRELNPKGKILLNMLLNGGGHHGASGRFNQLKEWAFSWAFALKVLKLV